MSGTGFLLRFNDVNFIAFELTSRRPKAAIAFSPSIALNSTPRK
jgi:hypothetical protein